METSVIIRTQNEEKWVGKVLMSLSKQTYKDFEVLIIDSGSTDKTLEIIKSFPVSTFHIKPEEFSYPFALNFGCQKANGSKYFVFLSGHSLPISDNWLEEGVKNFTKDEILGVYGSVIALPDATFWEKLFLNKLIEKTLRRKKVIRKARMGVLGFTNAIIRRDLWEKRKFNEAYGAGGEDGEWADFWFKRGYAAIRDPNFSVYHSHGLGILNLIKQWQYWKNTAIPKPFKKLNHRKNG